MSKILITGSTGFLGKYILDQLIEDKHSVYKIVRGVIDAPSTFSCDLAVAVPKLENQYFSKVVHVAGQAHIFPKSIQQEREQYIVNFSITKHLLEGLDSLKIPPKQFIFISSVAVYGCNSGHLIDETFPKNPTSGYGKAKRDSEILIQEWCEKKGVNFLCLRLPLIVGLNPPGNLGSILNAIRKGKYFSIRNNHAKKSVVLASDVSEFVSKVSDRISGVYHLTDGYHPSVMEIETAIAEHYNKKIRISLPLVILEFGAKIFDFMESIVKQDLVLNSQRILKLTSELTFNDIKARRDINWKSHNVLEYLKSLPKYV